MESTTKRSWMIVWLAALGLTVLSLVTHITSPSSIRLSEQDWQDRVAFHNSEPAFVARPFTNGIVAFAHDRLGLSVKTSFFGLQFLLMFISIPAFYHYLSRLGFDFGACIKGVFIYGLSLPVFLAHFDPVFTWSDFWVYAAVPLAFSFTLDGRSFLATLAMAVALLARETTLIFLPVWFLFIYRRDDRSLRKAILMSGAVVLVFAIYRYFNGAGNFAQPQYNLDFNFAYAMRTSDTIFSLLVSLGFLWVVGMWQASQKQENPFRYYNLIRFGAVFTVVGFVSSTLVMTFARESRIFFPPFVFLIPLALIWLDSRKESLRKLWDSVRPVPPALALVILIGISIGLSMLLFPHSEFRHWKAGNRTWLGLHIAAVIVFLAVQWRSRRTDYRSENDS